MEVSSSEGLDLGLMHEVLGLVRFRALPTKSCDNSKPHPGAHPDTFAATINWLSGLIERNISDR